MGFNSKLSACTCARSDTDETRDHALDGSDDRRFLEEDDVEPRPHQEACRSAYVGVEDSHGGVYIGGIRVTTVKTRPPHPQ